jgi:putative hemin transport protein
MHTMLESPQIIQSTVRTLKSEQPQLRMRDIAQRLGISEAALVASGCGSGAVRLQSDFAAQFAALSSLGRVMALTRNVCAVLEKVGVYGPLEQGAHASQMIGSEIDLRIFFHRFHVGFAVENPGPRGVSRSLQFFDVYGDAIHKVHLLPTAESAGSEHAFAEFVARFAADNQDPSQPSLRPRPTAADASIEPDVDVAALRAAYDQLQDTHEFFGLLRRFQLRRTTALRLLGDRVARPVDRLALRAVLADAATAQLPVMLFVGSSGLIQIHSGPVHNLKQYGPWFNVLDPGFNLHVHEPEIAAAWVVHKPTRDGLVSSLELFDEAGENLLLAFGQRKPGQAQSDAWRALLASLPSLESVASQAEPSASHPAHAS